MSELLTVRNRIAFDPRVQPLTSVWEASDAVWDTGNAGKAVRKRLRELALNLSPTVARAHVARKNDSSFSEQLRDALGAAKILLSQISMHLDRAWRDKLFAQLDRLLDAGSWDELDEVLDSGSFTTFLRMVLYQRPERGPALGISYRGHLLADWTVDRESLTIEFLPQDEVRWVLVRFVDDERETAAGQTRLERLAAVLSPYKPDRWFANAYQP